MEGHLLLVVTLTTLVFLSRRTETQSASICSETILVYFSSQGDVTVILSEEVTASPVTVSCSPSPFDGGLMVSFMESLVDVGSDRVVVNYTVTATGLPVRVTCSAQSAAGNQYTRETSRGQETMFQLAYPAAFLYPPLPKFVGTPMDILLGLHPPSPSEQDGGGDVTFLCSAKELASNETDLTEQSHAFCMEILTNTDMNATLATNITQTSSNLPAMVMPETLQFQPGVLYQNLMIRRNTAFRLQSAVSALFMLACCSVTSDKPGPLQSYNNLVVYHLIDINLQPIMETESRPTAVTSNSTSMSATCHCDLTHSSCDTNCCCDSECSTEDTRVFGDCVTGGRVTASQFDESCSSGNSNADEWHDLMCVVIGNNPSKGLFYESVGVADNNAQYDSLRLQRKITASYASQTIGNVDMVDSRQLVYRSGDPLLMTVTHADGSMTVGELALPSHTLTGVCSQASPIGYLANSQSSCNRVISTTSCTATSPLSVLSYLLPGVYTTKQCSPSPTVRTRPQSDVAAVTRHEYYCQSGVEADELSTLAWEFSMDLEKWTDWTDDPFDEFMLCGFAEGVNSENVPVATWFNNETGECKNVIEHVKYVLYWNAGSVVAVRALYLMTNVSLNEEETNRTDDESSGENYLQNANPIQQVILPQHFTVEFVYVPDKLINGSSLAVPLSALGTFLNSSAPRPGNPGYSLATAGPLLTGILDYGSGEVNVTYVDQLKLWQSARDSSCAEVKRQPVLFGQDAFSGCSLELSLQEFRENCDEVRERVSEEQESLVVATHVGRYATSDPLVETDWVEIVLNSRVMNSSSNDSQSLCAAIPAHVDVYVVYSMLTADQMIDQWQIVGVKVNVTYLDWEFVCSRSMCGNTTHSKFLVTSAVQFIRVSPANEPRVSRVEKQSRASKVCRYDSCLSEVYYPFRGGMNYWNKTETVAWALFFLLLFIVVLAVVQPWRS